MIPPYKGPSVNKEVNIPVGNHNDYQLYNLKEDIGQEHNLAQSNPKKLKELISSFEKIRGKVNNNITELKLE